MPTYNVALILTIYAGSPAEAVETAYGWCTDCELGADTEFHAVEAPEDAAPLLEAIERLPGIVVVAGDGTLIQRI